MMQFRKIGVFLLALLLTHVAQAQDTTSYDKLLAKAESGFGKNALQFNKDYNLASYTRWDYKQDSGKLIFSINGIPKIVASAQIVGSYSAYSSTWMWSWANESLTLG